MEAWRVHDTGLVAVPSRFRRLGGLVRHLQGRGESWPPRVRLLLTEDELRVTDGDGRALGAWPTSEVSAALQGSGPPVSFVIEVPDGAHLLAAAAGPATHGMLQRLAATHH